MTKLAIAGNHLVKKAKTTCKCHQEKKYMGARGELAPEMPKRAPKVKKVPNFFCIEFNAKLIKECNFNASKLESSPRNVLICFSLSVMQVGGDDGKT